MALVTGLHMVLPMPYSRNNSFGGFSMLLDAAGEQAGFVVQIPKTGDLAKFYWRTAGVTTGQDTDGRLETPDGSGMPSGNLISAGANGTILAASITANSLITCTLGTATPVLQGQEVCVVLAPGGTPVFNVQGVFDSIGSFRPYSVHKTGGIWAKSSVTAGNFATRPQLAFEYTDGTTEMVIGCASPFGISTATYNSGSTPDERALMFDLPFWARVKGCYASLDMDGDFEVVLYDPSNTAVSTLTMDKDYRSNDNGVASPQWFTLPTSKLIVPHATWRLAIKPTTVTDVVLGLYSTNAIRSVAGGMKATWGLSTRADGGAWTDSLATIPQMGLVIDAIDVTSHSSRSLIRGY